jgi:hypothetical protein
MRRKKTTRLATSTDMPNRVNVKTLAHWQQVESYISCLSTWRLKTLDGVGIYLCPIIMPSGLWNQQHN